MKPIDSMKKPKIIPKTSQRMEDPAPSSSDFATLFRNASAIPIARSVRVWALVRMRLPFRVPMLTNGAAMLENDTHLQLESPSRWYLAHLVSDDGMDVAGFLIPGALVILSGRTKSDLSWGITRTGMTDECDYFIEHLDSTGARYMLPNGTSQVLYDYSR